MTTNPPDVPRITASPDGGVILHLPEITYLDTQVWSVDIGLTDAGLEALRAAVLPAPADRATILREAADAIDATREPFPIAVQNGITWATAELRRAAAASGSGRVADETQARFAKYQTCGVCGAGYETGRACDACAFNARMVAEAGQPAVVSQPDGEA